MTTFSPYPKNTKGVDAFKAWLVANGGEVLAPTNIYEELRFRGGGAVGIVHRNDHGRPKKFNDHAHRLWQAFRAGKAPDLSPPKPVRISATIFADASFCPRSKAAGWACWIKTSDQPGIVLGGPIKTDCAAPQQAEVFALANAVQAAHARGILGGPGDTVSLQSDCTAALCAVMLHVPGTVESRHAEGARVDAKHLRPLTPLEDDALDVILALACECGIRIAVRHVRGHQAGGGRQWVNRQCDEVAHRHMRARRAEMTEQPWAPLPDEAAPVPSPSPVDQI